MPRVARQARLHVALDEGEPLLEGRLHRGRVEHHVRELAPLVALVLTPRDADAPLERMSCSRLG
jgi:hypothetical protein